MGDSGRRARPRPGEARAGGGYTGRRRGAVGRSYVAPGTGSGGSVAGRAARATGRLDPLLVLATRGEDALKALTETEWQTAILAYAKSHRWLAYHTHDARRSQAGFPDLTLVRAGRLVFAELKDMRRKPTEAQVEWLERLRDCIGVEAFLWRPCDIEQVRRVLA